MFKESEIKEIFKFIIEENPYLDFNDIDIFSNDKNGLTVLYPSSDNCNVIEQLFYVNEDGKITYDLLNSYNDNPEYNGEKNEIIDEIEAILKEREQGYIHREKTLTEKVTQLESRVKRLENQVQELSNKNKIYEMKFLNIENYLNTLRKNKKVTEESKILIKKLFDDGFTYTQIQEQTGLSRGTLNNIKFNRI